MSPPAASATPFDRAEFAEGQVSTWADTPSGSRATLVRVALPNQDVLYELAETTELNGALTTLGQVLAAAGLVTALLGAAIGQLVVRRVLTPLHDIGQTAERIRAGELTQRLVVGGDPDLKPIVGSFNAMVEALDQRIQRDARFAADVSHELRSPLTTLVASVDLLQRRRATLDDRSRATLDLMSRELDRFRTVLEDLVDLGRLEADAGWSPEPADLGRVSAKALDSLGVEKSRLQADGPPIIVLADPGALERAISNLVRNAELHGHGLRRITVTANAREGIVRVHDAGPGISPEDQSRIFDRFVRGGTRGDRPGSGLGLSIVRETMNHAGGSVECRDSPLGCALFELRLPLADNPSPTSALST